MSGLILAALVVLLLVLAYLAEQRARYIDLFRTYGAYRGPGCPSPWKIMLAVERPWAQRLFLSRPITTPMAKFALYLTRSKGATVGDLCVGFAQPGYPLEQILDQLTASPSSWGQSANPLAARFAVPYDSPIVNLYRGVPAVPGGAALKATLPLSVLYGAGFLALAELETTGASTSLEDLWQLCFAEQIPPAAKTPPPPASQCESAGSHGLSGAFGGAGIGAMIGEAIFPGIGAIVGGLLGGIGGGVAGVAANNGACCLTGSCA